MKEMGDLRAAIAPKVASPAPWSRVHLLVASSLAVIGLLVLLHYIAGEYVGGVLVYVHQRLDRLFSSHPLAVLALFQTLFLLAHFFILPIHSLLCIALTVIVREFWLALGVCLAFSLLSSCLQYFVVQKLIYQRIWRRYRANELLNLLLEESNKHPFRVALMARLLAVPVGLKDYLLALIHSPFSAYLGSAVVSNLIFLTSAVSIGISLDNLDELLEEKRPWSQKSFAEKLSVILFFVVFLFTSSAVLLITLWTRRKLASRQTQKQMELGTVRIPLER